MAKFQNPFADAPRAEPPVDAVDWRWVDQPPAAARADPPAKAAPRGYDEIPSDTFRGPLENGGC